MKTVRITAEQGAMIRGRISAFGTVEVLVDHTAQALVSAGLAVFVKEKAPSKRLVADEDQNRVVPVAKKRGRG